MGDAPLATLTARTRCRYYDPDLGHSTPTETATVTIVRTDLPGELPRPGVGSTDCADDGRSITVSWREPLLNHLPIPVTGYRWRFLQRPGGATSGMTEGTSLTFAGAYGGRAPDFYVAADYGPARSGETRLHIKCQ